jgi:hypothetical protein
VSAIAGIRAGSDQRARPEGGAGVGRVA